MYKRNKVCDVVVTASLINIDLLLNCSNGYKTEEEKATPKQYISLRSESRPGRKAKLEDSICFQRKSRMSPTV